MSLCHVRSSFVIHADQATLYLDLGRFPKFSLNIVTSSSSSIKASMDAGWAVHNLDCEPYLCIFWQLYFLWTLILCTVTLAKVVVALYCSWENLHICWEPFRYCMTHKNYASRDRSRIIDRATFLAYSESLDTLDPSWLARTWCDEDKLLVLSARTTRQTCSTSRIAIIHADQCNKLSCGPLNLGTYIF